MDEHALVTTHPPRTTVLVEAWTGAAVPIRAELTVVGVRGVLGQLNAEPGPVLTLTKASLEWESGAAVVILPLHELLWLRPVGVELAPRDSLLRVAKAQRPVVVHVGPFEISGTAHVHPDVRWADFLSAARFFALTSARVAWHGQQLEVAFAAVNAKRVSALIAVER